MPNTTNESLPYPAGTVGVPPDVRGDIQSLATAADGKIHEVRGIANLGGTDTGWSLSAVSTATGWDTKTDPLGNTSGTLTGGVRKIGSEVTGSWRESRNGGTISGGSTGNISPDVLVGTLASGYRPSGPRYGSYAVPGVASGQCRVDPSGTVSITTINNGATIPNNTPVQFDIVFPVG